MGIYNDINKRLDKSKLDKLNIIDLLNNKNLNNNQNYIITDKKKRRISKKLLKLFYFGFTDSKKRLAKYGIIKKIEVPFFTAKIIFFLVFMFFFLLLGYLLITEYSDEVLFGFLFILFWGFLVFIIPELNPKFNVRLLYDKNKYVYYFHKDNKDKWVKEYLNGIIKISYDRK